MKTYLLIDSHALIHRAYHAMPYLQTKSGVPSGALFGLTNMILNAIEKFAPTYIFAANDLPKTTFREMAFKDYKGHRSKTDDALIEQIIAMPKIFETFQIPLLSMEGYEADDVIGTLVKKKQKENRENNIKYKIIILTGDMDIMQLVDGDKVVVYTGRKGEEDFVFNEEKVFEKHGLKPMQIPDYKGLRGDTSDNIPGIKGIGEKTAMQILNAGENLKNIFNLLEQDKEGKKINKEFFGITERMFELLKNGQEDAEFSKELATINCEINIDVPEIENFDLNKNVQNLKDMCQEYGFNSIFKKLESVERKNFKGEIKMEEYLDTTTSSSLREVAPFEEGSGNTDTLVQFSAKVHIENSVILSVLELKKAKIGLWVLNSDETNIDEVRVKYLFNKLGFKNLQDLEKELENKNLYYVYEQIELPLIPLLEESNKIGIKVDREKLQVLLNKYGKEKQILVTKIYALAGQEFNLNSPKQLGEILFEKIKVQDMKNGEEKQLGEKSSKMKKTAGGKISTKADVLEEMKDNHEIVPLILNYRETEKMINTYLEPLLMHSTFDSRIHTTFIQTGAATGRFASTNPNVQNIPVKGEEGKELRKCFIASESKVLIAADYSQIELRIAAMLSGDEYLQKIYENDEDIHTSVAMKMFRKNKEEINKDERNAAKAMNFGILYGMGVSSIKNTLKVERNIAQAFYDSYTLAMPNLMKYLKDTISKAKDLGYTETLYGRQRQLQELFSPIPMVRASGERMAMNAPIQGSSADIIKLAMLDFKQACVDNKWGVESVAFLLQIHDEIIFEVDKNLQQEVERELKKVMENVLLKNNPKINFSSIPLIANIKSGPNWGEM